MKYLLDTNALADAMFDRNGVLDRVFEIRRSGHTIGTCMPVIAELAAGIEYSQTRDRNMAIVRIQYKRFRLWPFDLAAAWEYGRLEAYLRRNGRPMQIVDMMVASIAKTLTHCTIVSTDSDYKAIPGLLLENWSTSS